MASEPIPAPLVPFAGARPPAPAWFEEALKVEPERASHQGAGVTIETLAWGERGMPGLLLLHGGSAHADWWSHLAPFFARTHRVVASSWSGMGGSGWRPAGNQDYACYRNSDDGKSAADLRTFGTAGGSCDVGIGSMALR